jgi:SP family general alpha glucoside:H+ symporter-like MFS transporter
MATEQVEDIEKSEPLRFPTKDHLDPDIYKANVILDAKKASDSEHQMTLWQGIRLYPKAVGWSILISTCICMEGYDVCLLSNFYSFPPFNRKYGEQLSDGTYQVPARWQSGLSNGANCGEIIGLFINGFVSERFGYRYTVMTCLVLIIAFTAIFFTAQSVVAIQVAELLCGLCPFLPSSCVSKLTIATGIPWGVVGHASSVFGYAVAS